MILTHKLTLSLDNRELSQTLDAVQGDSARVVELSLLEGGAPWAVPEGTEAVIRYHRPNRGTGGIYSQLENGEPAWSISENKVTLRLVPQVLASAGPVELQVTLMKDGQELTCFSFWVRVQGILADPDPDSETYVNLTDHIQATLEGMDLATAGSGLIFVTGDYSSQSGNWKAFSDEITSLYDGLTIAFKTVAAGGGGGTNLTINNMGPIPVYRNATQTINYVYPANSVLILTYTISNGKSSWQTVDMNTDTDTKFTTGSADRKTSKLYLVGGETQNDNGVKTYSNSNCYIGTDSRLYSNKEPVLTESTLPKEVPDYVRQEAERVAALAHGRQNANTVTLLLGADVHSRLGSDMEQQMLESARHAAQAMGIIRHQIHVDAAGILGDLLWDQGETVQQAMEMTRILGEYFGSAFRGLPQFWCKGNHDMLSAAQTELTDEQVFAAILLRSQGVEFDSSNRVLGYCHRDLKEQKLRILCLNTSETSASHAVGTAQLNWLENMLQVDAGWKVIILSHCPLDWWGTTSSVYGVVESYADKILCNIHGHTHNYITGTVGQTSIPRLAIPNIDFYRPNTYGDNPVFGEAVAYSKVANSAMDTAFCVVTIDPVQGKIYADHYGSGLDREIALNGEQGGGDGGEAGGYTNQIPLSVNADGSPYNSGMGYKTGTRINSSGVEEKANGMCCTGFIPISGSDVVRIKNVTVAGSETPYLILRNDRSEGTPINGSISGASAFPAADAQGVITIHIGELNPDATYLRLSVGQINDTSILTINQPIE